MSVYRYIVTAGAVMAAAAAGAMLMNGSAALAQGKELFSGHVVSVDNSGSTLIVQLDAENSCGSFTYAASTQEIKDTVQAALDEAAQYNPGSVTLKVQGCASGAAVIIGAAGGPDYSEE